MSEMVERVAKAISQQEIARAAALHQLPDIGSTPVISQPKSLITIDHSSPAQTGSNTYVDETVATVNSNISTPDPPTTPREPDHPEKVRMNDVADILNWIAKDVHERNHKWWHDVHGRALERNKGELLCLIHSEISEAMEGERKSLMDDHLPHRPMAEVELADAMIRIFDYAEAHGYDIGGAFVEKLEYNAKRADHKHEARAQAGGKKW